LQDFSTASSSSSKSHLGFLLPKHNLPMADAGAVDLDTGAMMEKWGRGHPRGSKNKPKDASLVASSSSTSMKQRPGCPLGSKNKPKPSFAVAQGASAAPRNASPPPVKTFSLFVIASAQCHE
jgi:hypothetical protein